MIFRDETRNSLCLRHHHFNYVVVAAADAAAAAVIRRIWLHTLYARKSALKTYPLQASHALLHSGAA